MVDNSKYVLIKKVMAAYTISHYLQSLYKTPTGFSFKWSGLKINAQKISQNFLMGEKLIPKIKNAYPLDKISIESTDD